MNAAVTYRPMTVLIDGPSGAGKTTAALRLGERLGWQVLHLDDFYPGWGGLAKGSAMVAHDVLRLESPGYRRWDWYADGPGEWVPLDPAASLIVEGVGALSRENLQAAQRRGGVLGVVLDAPVDKRKDRALNRDPGYRPWWDMWASQERVHFSAWVRDGVVPDLYLPTTSATSDDDFFSG